MMRCRWCHGLIVGCPIENCRGWMMAGCTGWMHTDLFHGCPGGKHCAEEARTP